MATNSFAAQVGRHIARYKDRMEAVFKEATQATIREAQTPVSQGGRMPVDTGFLRNSLVSGLNGSTSLTGAEVYVLTIAQAEITDTIEAGWTANYAKYVEAGSQGRTGRFFMRGAAQNWRRHVRDAAARYKT